MSRVREAFTGRAMSADSTTKVTGSYLAGFLAKTSGTSTVTSFEVNGSSAVTVVDAVPVTQGVYTPIPLLALSPDLGFTVTLAGGASGTLFI